jgi:hypothetical protein
MLLQLASPRLGRYKPQQAAVVGLDWFMTSRRIVLLLLVLAFLGIVVWRFTRPEPQRPSAPPQQPAPLPLPPPVPEPPPPPAPQPVQPLPPPEAVTLTMLDGNPLRAHWYPAPQPNAPVVVLDAGAGQDIAPWLLPVEALLAQRPVNVLWLDDMQPRHADDIARRTRAEERWRVALAWLDVRAPKVRVALVGLHEAGDAIWPIADQPRPLSLAVIAPDGQPLTALAPAVTEKFAYVVLKPSFDPTPTWLNQLHNVRVHAIPGGLTAETDPQLQTDLPGWLFVALGPR